jgi:uncharacterized membrane protein
MRKPWVGLVITAVAVAVSLWAYPRLPDTIPSHWNVRGDPDGYSSKLAGVALLPAVLLGFTALFQVFPRIDPRRSSYPRFTDTYWLLVNGVLVFVLLLHLTIVAIGLGYDVPLNRVVMVGGGGLLALVGNYLGRVEPNWFLGIRTPWTLSSDTVWRKTHRTGAWVFVTGGVVVAVMGLVLPVVNLTLLGIVAAVMGGIPLVQSYVLWRKEQAK